MFLLLSFFHYLLSVLILCRETSPHCLFAHPEVQFISEKQGMGASFPPLFTSFQNNDLASPHLPRVTGEALLVWFWILSVKGWDYYFCWCLNFLISGQWVSFHVGTLILLTWFVTFVHFAITRCSRPILCVLGFKFETGAFSKELWLLYLGVVFQWIIGVYLINKYITNIGVSEQPIIYNICFSLHSCRFHIQVSEEGNVWEAKMFYALNQRNYACEKLLTMLFFCGALIVHLLIILYTFLSSLIQRHYIYVLFHICVYPYPFIGSRAWPSSHPRVILGSSSMNS